MTRFRLCSAIATVLVTSCGDEPFRQGIRLSVLPVADGNYRLVEFTAVLGDELIIPFILEGKHSCAVSGFWTETQERRGRTSCGGQVNFKLLESSTQYSCDGGALEQEFALTPDNELVSPISISSTCAQDVLRNPILSPLRSFIARTQDGFEIVEHGYGSLEGKEVWSQTISSFKHE